MSPDASDRHLLLLIHERLDVIEGKVTLIARADKKAHLAVIEEDVRATPTLADVYLAIDGKRTQDQIRKDLDMALGTASGRFRALLRLGVIELRDSNRTGKIYGHEPSAESILDLSANMTKWKADMAKTVGAKAARS